MLSNTKNMTNKCLYSFDIIMARSLRSLAGVLYGGVQGFGDREE